MEDEITEPEKEEKETVGGEAVVKEKAEALEETGK